MKTGNLELPAPRLTGGRVPITDSSAALSPHRRPYCCTTLGREEPNVPSKFQRLPENSELLTSCLKGPPFRTSPVLKSPI